MPLSNCSLVTLSEVIECGQYWFRCLLDGSRHQAITGNKADLSSAVMRHSYDVSYKEYVQQINYWSALKNYEIKITSTFFRDWLVNDGTALAKSFFNACIPVPLYSLNSVMIVMDLWTCETLFWIKIVEKRQNHGLFAEGSSEHQNYILLIETQYHKIWKIFTNMTYNLLMSLMHGHFSCLQVLYS